MQRLGIGGNRIAEPAEIGRLVGAVGIMPQCRGALEIRPAQRYPDSPSERAIAVQDRNLNKTANEEVLIVDYALITAELASTIALCCGNRTPWIRSVEVPCKERSVEQ